MRNKLILLGAVLLLFCDAWSEDELTLKTGAVFKGEIVKNDESGVTIELTGGKGTISLKQEEVASVSLEEPELFALATASYKKGDHEKALRLYREAAGQYASYDWGEKAQFLVGESNLKLRRWENALTAYRELLNTHPQSDYIHRAKLGMAHAHCEQGRYEKAVKIYRALISQEAEIAAQALCGLGNCYFEQEEFESALISYLKVVVLYYDFEGAVEKSLFSSGRCYEKLGDFKRARVTYQEVIAKYPKSEYAKIAEERLRKVK